MRTDVHKPSAIVPDDYQFIALGYQKSESIDECYSVAENQRILREFMERTGAKFSTHYHGGNCHICGAHCLYTVIFYHEPTNTLIKTGMDCAEKLDYCDELAFRNFRHACKGALDAKAGKHKARALLDEAGIGGAWELYQLDENPIDERPWKCRECDHGCPKCPGNSWDVLCSIVGNLIRYGNISDAQIKLVEKLVDKINNWERLKQDREARRQAEREAAEDCPTGRVKITGEVVSKKWKENAYGGTLKMLVRSDQGYKLWGTVPSSLQLIDTVCEEELDERYDIDRLRDNGHEVIERAGKFYLLAKRQRGIEKGDRVEFTATCEPSPDDPKFGFYSRPSKAKLL